MGRSLAAYSSMAELDPERVTFREVSRDLRRWDGENKEAYRSDS